MAAFLRFAYLTKLRRAWNRFCQEIFDNNDLRRPLPSFNAPEEIWEYSKNKFQYRHDPKSGILDYFSDPEVFHWRLLVQDIPDGDCDDLARFFAACLLPIKEVDKVCILHTGYEGNAHATVVYRYKDQWFHFDYGIKPIAEPQDAVYAVVQRYSDKDKPLRAYYWCFESFNCYPIAINPRRY